MEINVPPNEVASFDVMFLKFGITMMNLKQIILAKCLPLHKLKSILEFSYRALKPRLTHCESVDAILDIIGEKCSLLNLTCMEAIAEHFQIQEAQDSIICYYTELSDFCQMIRLSSCIGKKFIHSYSLSSNPLKCETLKFILHGETDDYTLSDIKGILWKAFGELAKEVIVVSINPGSSIIVTCSSSHTLTTLLVLNAQRNDSLLKDMGVVSLVIGYCSVIEHIAPTEVCDITIIATVLIF